MLGAVINGIAVTNFAQALSVEERGLSYGDGVFETMRLVDGKIHFLASHLTRLQIGCERLGITPPTNTTVASDMATLIPGGCSGVVKFIVTRGAGGRGYRGQTTLDPTRIALLYPPPSETGHAGIAVRWCTTRLSRNPQLAGIKHLNRLEQVLAQNEWTDERIGEGLMLDTEAELICATASNLFIVCDGVLATPDLRFAGIRGVMREQVIKQAQQLGMAVAERALRSDDLLNASEAFVTNAVRGIRPIELLGEQHWPMGPIAARLMTALNDKA
jgi:4-amino-4-deoxychorismate lyase